MQGAHGVCAARALVGIVVVDIRRRGCISIGGGVYFGWRRGCIWTGVGGGAFMYEGPKFSWSRGPGEKLLEVVWQ